jgi:hypothetical protein
MLEVTELHVEDTVDTSETLRRSVDTLRLELAYPTRELRNRSQLRSTWDHRFTPGEGISDRSSGDDGTGGAVLSYGTKKKKRRTKTKMTTRTARTTTTCPYDSAEENTDDEQATPCPTCVQAWTRIRQEQMGSTIVGGAAGSSQGRQEELNQDPTPNTVGGEDITHRQNDDQSTKHCALHRK